MARWKLTRLIFGNNEEFTLLDGEEVSVGRGINNNISLSSIVISRNHCVLNVQKDQVLITDLKSSNGVYVGLKKIPPNIPYSLQELDVIGIGWTRGAPVANIKDTEKYMFKLTKEKPPPINSRIMYQSDNEFEDLETELAIIDGPVIKTSPKKTTPEKNKTEKSPVINKNTAAKRKLDINDCVKVKKEKTSNNIIHSDVINISDSENEMPVLPEKVTKKPKLDAIIELEVAQPAIKEEIKVEKDDEYDPFKVKQEYLGYDVDEPIQIDSDSDDESAHWRMRLSQSSPAKSLTKPVRESKAADLEESCYSQMDDFEDDIFSDLITIPPQPPENVDNQPKQQTGNAITDKISIEEAMKIIDTDTIEGEEFLDDLISLDKAPQVVPQVINDIDTVDGSFSNSKALDNLKSTVSANIDPQPDKVKQAQMIDPLAQIPRSKPNTSTESKPKPSTSSKHNKDKHKDKKHSSSSSKIRISDSQKEERKRKLKELATKEKEDNEKSLKTSTSSSKEGKEKAVSKLSNTNRGAFLTEVAQGVVKPTTRKEGRKSSKNKDKEVSITHKEDKKELAEDVENKKKESDKRNSSKHKDTEKLKDDPKDKDSAMKTKSSHTHSKSHKREITADNAECDSKANRNRVPLKSLKPLSESEESFSGKPFSKVEPLPPSEPARPKKSVRFSQQPPKVHVFEIEPGNNMKKTSLVKTSLLDSRPAPAFSLEKMTLMRVFRWNPQWLDEQMNQPEPPPILGHHNPPMTMFHSFSNHHQYVELVGDLLLIEIWECLTQGFNRLRGVHPGIMLRIASLPPVSTQDRCYELFNLSVNVSVPNTEVKIVPRMGEIMIVAFGPENARCKRFFYVHNVRQLASPPNNKNNFYCISLHTCYTDKMKDLKPGEQMVGLSLAYIQKELMLFEAMEHLAGSPLSEAILTPEPKHFIKCEPINFPVTQWTKFLNPSQQVAVHSAVTAALGDRPCIEMIQGPPGTGKSSVISAIVMTYFYDTNGRKHQNRGKILICATSNAAVDELVIRLLNIRQNLPKTERFRMVRVGRAEAMHPRAFDISSLSLAQRDTAARCNEPLRPGLTEEISTLEAKINMWQTQELDAKDPSRAAYCRERVKSLMNRIAMMRAGGGGGGCGGGGSEKEVRAEQVALAERRIIEGADIVVTTLSSAHSQKMRGLRRRIALCIIDEAGQAIEPETLIPLTLDVTKLTLIGDPQQLPGFICSQRARKLGLGESLFYRLTSCAETWPAGSPVILLNQQYRMQADIADYPNRAFYGGRIVSMPPPRPPLDIPPYSIVSISSGDKGQGSSGANEMEAWGVARLVMALQSALRAHGMSLAVITPYNAHKEIIKRNLKLLQDPVDAVSAMVEVNTVDSFQGQERDVVVVSLARSQGLGFLADAGRMNVMLTRARHALLVCLNPHAMIKNFQWRTLVEDAERRKMYRYLPSRLCQGLTAGQIPHSEVLKYVKNHKTGSK